MRKQITLLFIGLLFLGANAFGQLTIEECQALARENYPLIKQYGLIEQSQAYNLSNANKAYLPQLSLSAQATYQSDITKIPEGLGDALSMMTGQNVTIASVNQDQYKVLAELNQVIWDGGVVRSQKEQIKSANEVEKQKLEVELYQLNERATQLFFGILALNEQLKQMEILEEELQTNFKRVEAYKDNGVANQTDLDIISVEQLKVKQKKIGLNAIRKAYNEVLLALIGGESGDTVKLVKPASLAAYNRKLAVNRPELRLFDAQSNYFASQESTLKAANLPKLGVFAQGGLGDPGLNMFEPGFTPFYIVGARLSWNLSSFYTKKNSLYNIEVGKQNVEVQKETFLYNLNMQVTQINNEIEKLTEQIKSDDEIIRLRRNIKKAAEVKVENGTFTVTDLIREINAENSAIMEKSLHEIELLMAIYKHKNSTNN